MADDRPFLCRLYASTRETELAMLPWDAAQKAAFLEFQFTAQDTHYRRHYPGATYDVVCAGERPIGRLYVDRRADSMGVLDIALLPEYRGRGIGTALMQRVLAEARATNRAVTLHVDRGSAAMRLYERLGFRVTGEAPVHIAMEWRPPT